MVLWGKGSEMKREAQLDGQTEAQGRKDLESSGNDEKSKDAHSSPERA
jgi:hypothetical protein